MKLCVSNIAWDSSEDAQALQILRNKSVRFLEIAPTKIWKNLTSVSINEARAYKNYLENLEITPVSMQSLLFGQPDLILFGDQVTRDRLLKYLEKVLSVAKNLNIHYAVFGSPKNRIAPEPLNSESWQIAEDFFRQLALLAQSYETQVVLEANPSIYGCNFLTTTEEACRFVKRLQEPGLRINLDVGTIIANQEDFESLKAYKDLISHVQISEPFLEHPVSKHAHIVVARFLKEIGYSKYISLEMKRTDSWHQRLETALEFVSEVYFR